MKNKFKKLSLNPKFSILNSRQAFTLIEMLIVVAIIGILASAIMVGLGPAQQKGRDARRMSDLNQAQNALELYYTQNGQYPGTVGSAVTFSSLVNPNNIFSAVGIKNFPTTDSSGNDYCYEATGDGSVASGYIIGTKLEIQPTSDTSHNCTTLTSCGNVTTLNYCISF